VNQDACGCVRWDRHDCADVRSGRDLRRALDAETLADALDDEGCTCGCHDEDWTGPDDFDGGDAP
jgi:hypothetical protein